MDGFTSVERFHSLSNPERFVSIAFFVDEAALDRGRNIPEHRKAQVAGRDAILAGYRLRSAHVLGDYRMEEWAEAPSDSRD